jgi:hypothetical protein
MPKTLIQVYFHWYLVLDLWSNMYSHGSHLTSQQYWNLTEVAQIIISFIAIGTYFVRMNMTKDIIELFEETYGNGYTRLDKVHLINEYLMKHTKHISSFCSFHVHVIGVRFWCKFVKLRYLVIKEYSLENG